MIRISSFFILPILVQCFSFPFFERADSVPASVKLDSLASSIDLDQFYISQEEKSTQDVGLVVSTLVNSSNALLASLSTPSSVACVTSLIDSLYPQCWDDRSTQQTLLDHERRHYAISLSICQWRVSYVPYPESCSAYDPIASNVAPQNEWHGKKCLNALQESTTLWTTYNGYYQAIGTICTEIAPEIRLKKLLKTYTKITAVQHKMATELSSLVSQMHTDSKTIRETILQTVLQSQDLVKSAVELVLHQELAKHMETLKQAQTNHADSLRSAQQDHASSLQALRKAHADDMEQLAKMLGIHMDQIQTQYTQSVQLMHDSTANSLGGIVQLLASVEHQSVAVVRNLDAMAQGQQQMIEQQQKLLQEQSRTLGKQQALAQGIRESVATVETDLMPQFQGLVEKVANVTEKLESVSIESTLQSFFREAAQTLTKWAIYGAGGVVAVWTVLAVISIGNVFGGVQRLASLAVAILVCLFIVRAAEAAAAWKDVIRFSSLYFESMSILIYPTVVVIGMLSGGYFWHKRRQEQELQRMMNLPWELPDFEDYSEDELSY